MSVPADKQIKSGFLNVPPASWIQTVLNKPWTRKQCVLYPASRQGVKRLEVFDLLPSLRRKEPAGLIIPLTDCLKVAEQRHKEHPFVFSVRTRDSSHVFETANVQELREWVDALQRIAFGDVSDTLQQRLSAPEHIVSDSVDYNDLYENVERRSVFPVVVEENETASALRLRGPHRLEVSASAVLLRDDDFTLRYTWLFKHIRRYGQTKGAFVLEAGRSSETGAGTFVFRTRSAAQLHAQLQTAMTVLEKHHRASGGLATSAVYPGAAGAVARPQSPAPAVPLAEEPLQTQTLGRKSVKRAPKMSKPPRRSKPGSSGGGAARAAAAPEATHSPLPNVVPLAEKQWLYTQSCDLTSSGVSSGCGEPLYANDEDLGGAASAELVYAEPEERQAAWKQLARNTVEHTEHSAPSSQRSSGVLGLELGEEMLRGVTSSGGARGSASYACLQHMAPRAGEPTTPGQYARLTPLTPTGGSTGGPLIPLVAPSAATADTSKESAEAAAAAITADDENLYENFTIWDSAVSDGDQIYENVPSGKPGDVSKKPEDSSVRHMAINQMEYALIDKPLLRQLNSGPF